jgi:Fic family protein
MTALAAGDVTTALAELDTARDHTTQARRTAKAALSHRARTGAAMRPGQLRDRVREHLAANPGASLTPHEISRVLGNSSGAIANALDKLTELGHAQLASDHPRRYVTTG